MSAILPRSDHALYAVLKIATIHLAAVLLIFFSWNIASAQDSDASNSSIDVQIAPVVVDGIELFEVSGVSGAPARDRAAGIVQSVIEIAAANDSEQVSMRIRETEFGREILGDDIQIMVVTDVDVNRENLEDSALLAEIYAARLEEAILAYRAGRTAEARKRGVIDGIIWTAVFVGFVLLLVRLHRRLPARVERIVRRYMSVVQEATQEIIRARAIAEIIAVIVQGLLVVLFFVALYYYVSIILFAFAETRPFAVLLLEYVSEPILDGLNSLIDFIPSLIILLIIFFVTRYLIRIARVTFENIEAGTVKIEGFQKHWVWPSFNIVRAFLIAAAIVISFPHIPGSNSDAFRGISILLGAMLSLGSNSVVSNVMAGLFVIYRRSTNIGDLIKIGDHLGVVTAIKLTETHLKSSKNELISIPNAQMLNSDVVNYSLHIDGRGMILHTEVGIGYDEPQQKIEALLIKAAQMTKGIKRSPEPFVLRKALGDFAVTYEINGFSTRDERIPKILSDLRANILDVFHAADVQIMSPNYEGDPDEPKIPPVPDADAADTA